MMINELETWLKVAAIIAAAMLFLWKLFTGWLIINLQISMDLKRQPYNDENDLLAIQLNLKKGSTDTLWIQDISLRVVPDGLAEKQIFIGFPEINQLAVENKKLDWKASNNDQNKITLSPDESVQFGKATMVPRDRPVQVEAAVFGDRTFWSKGFQWRASGISLPVPKETLPK